MKPGKLFTVGREFADFYPRAVESLSQFDNPGELADIIAITSPRVHLRRNMRLASQVLRGEKPRDILPNVWRSLAHYWNTGEIRGKKTSAFASNLRGDFRPVTLDVWMARAYGIPQTKLFRKDNFARIVRSIGALSRLHRIPPASIQAGIWAGAIIRSGRKPNYLPVELLEV